MRPRFSSSFRRGLAVDALVYLQGHGIVLDEPSVVAIDLRDGSSIRRRLGGQGDDRACAGPHRQLVRLLRDSGHRRLRDVREDAPPTSSGEPAPSTGCPSPT